MIKFTSQYEEGAPLIEVTLSSDSTVGDVLEVFQGFLAAAGYSINGVIDVINTEDEAFVRTK